MPVFFILVAIVIVFILILMLPIYGKIGGFVLHLFGADEEDSDNKDNEDTDNNDK